MTFDEWWNSGPNGRREGAIGLARQAWDAAVQAERKRCLEVVRLHQGASSGCNNGDEMQQFLARREVELADIAAKIERDPN